MITSTEAPPPSLVGRPAGIVSRAGAYVLDVGITVVTFSVGVAVTMALIGLATGGAIVVDDPFDGRTAWYSLAYSVWWVVYFGVSVSRFGRTPAKALLGLRVERRKGGPVGPVRAAIRAMAVPFLLAATFGLDALAVIITRDRKALHDMVTGTRVVYAWEAQPATRTLRMSVQG